jgi:hypothetical protein
MAKCPKCNSKHYLPKCMQCLYAETPQAKKGVLPCEWPCTATIHVQETGSGRGIPGIVTVLDGENGSTDGTGFRVRQKLAPGDHKAWIMLYGMEDRYARPIGVAAAEITKSIASGENQFYVFMLDPLTKLKVVVRRRHKPAGGIANAKVTVAGSKAGNTLAMPAINSSGVGESLYTRLREDTYALKVELDDTAKAKFVLENAEHHHALNLLNNPDECVFWVRLVIHLRLKYSDPDGTDRHFPKDFPAQVVFNEGTTLDVKVLDDTGHIKFEVDSDAKTDFTLKFDSTSVRLLTHEKAKPDAKLVLDPDTLALEKLSTDGLQFFSLPKTWALAQSEWTAVNAGKSLIPADGKILIPEDGIGTEAAPVKLTLKPKLQYVRIEYFDRKYLTDHGNNRIAIPQIALLATRSTDPAGAPVAPTAGTQDVISNWIIDKDSLTAACQCVPWIITKTDAGVDLPRLTNSMLLEFAAENRFVVAKGANARTLETIPTGDERRKPSKDRDQFYDLPKLWKNWNYYTRLSAVPGKFFDELTEDEIAESSAKAKPLRFSLDDIVLTKNDGSQVVKDRDVGNGEIDRTKYSRFTILHLDRADERLVKVWKPRADAVYHSDLLFVKEAGATVYRNCIIDHPPNARAVLFCSGMHDVWDKRTESASKANKAICGARAARLDDADVTAKKAFSDPGDVAAGYVHRTRGSNNYFLHYADTDGATVFGIMLSHFSIRAFSLQAEKPGVWDATKRPIIDKPEPARKYRKDGLKNAMVRWNEKKYQYEQADKGNTFIIKSFFLFEAKDIEDPLGTLRRVGGMQNAWVGICDDTGRSNATDTIMYMRESAYRDEGMGPRGTVPAARDDYTDYQFAGRYRNAFAHELGHAVVGLWDDYLTQKEYGVVAGFKEVQRYKGVPLNRDKRSMMSTNEAVRLRSLWGRARWMKAAAASGGVLNPFVGDKAFHPTWPPAGGKAKLIYELPDQQISYWTPRFTEDPVSLGEKGRAALHLYALGNDEFAAALPGGACNAIVVIDIRIAVKYCPGLTPAPKDWTTATAYAVGNVVDFEAGFHVCIEAHTGSAEFTTDSAQWIALDLYKAKDWADDNDVTIGALLKEVAQSYVVRSDFKTGSKVDSFWQAKGADRGAWAANGSNFAVGDIVTQGGGRYVCKTANVSGGAFDGGNWQAAGAARGAYTKGTDYVIGDECGSEVCTTAHKAGSVAADEKAKRVAKSDCTLKKWEVVPVAPPNPPPAPQFRKQMMAEINKAILIAVEGLNMEGKFRLDRTGDKFSKIFVRMFPQFFDITEGLVPGGGAAHFTLEVNNADSKGFGPAAQTIKISKNVDGNTLVRYLLGRISDDRNTRKNQTPTADLAVADLNKLSDWIHGKLGSTLTGATIP